MALKAFGPDIVHKTEVGAVELGLRSPEEVAGAADRMRQRVSAAGLPLDGFLVQEMIEAAGVEMLVGMANDPLFGPVVACSAGGVTVELVRDVAVRVTPITDVDAAEMVRELRTFPLLEGFRGAPPGDVGALIDVVLRLSAIASAHDAITEMDANPVIVHTDGAVVVERAHRRQHA